jgi:Carboxypeptidase regulatory-like domain
MKLFRMGVVVAFLLMLVFANVVAGQSLTAGSIAGRVTDPTGAVVANAAVSLKSLDTGEEQSTATGADGNYRFNLLKPGRYEITVTVSGFAKTVQATTVSVGQTSDVSIALEISKTAETIEVSAAAPLVSTEPGVATSYTPEEVALLPAAGGDITTLAFTAPGVVVAQGTGYGNFTVNGLPGTSNLFTVNGENDMDPYFNINNSGATNLNLGSNEVQELTVVTNPYSGQYGQLSGAQISYVTKSGTNAFHGNAQWFWNGRAMNSNDFFSNASDAPRPFSNANQWAASIGGPVIKDHTWFFVDTEGLRFILPNVDVETIPTPAFSTALLNNIAALQPNELPAYTGMMKIYANASAGKVLTPVSVSPGDECATVTMIGWTSGSTCANTFVSTPTSFAHEWILAGRIDQKLTAKDDLFFRFKLDYGLQPTTVDPLSSNFDANSNQPAWDYQVNWRHVFNSNMTNSFTATLSHYVAQFTQNSAAVKSEFPYPSTEQSSGVYLAFNDAFSNINAQISAFPQGRNITQYQFIDDYSWTHGRHSFKFGANFRRYDVSDHNFFNINPLAIYFDLTSPTLGPANANGITQTGMQSFVNGLSGEWLQQYSPTTDVPIALWGLGGYLEDQWKVSPTLTVMGALRFEHNANPVCNTNCLSNFKTSFPNLPSVTSASPADVPYSSDFNTSNHNAFPSSDAINVSPRLSFSWAPNASDRFPWFPGGNKTIISGGVGIFYDNPAAGTLDNLLGNPPRSVLFGITPLDAAGNPYGIVPYDLSNPKSGPNSFAAASAAFNVNESYNQLSAALNPIIGYTPPISPTAIVGTIHSPQVQEWNLKVDQEITKSVAFSASYNGNHSINVLYYNSWWNASSGSGFWDVPGMNPNPAPNYGEVRTLQSGAVSNYNGLTTSIRIQHRGWLMAHLNYTYAHALDETSNGGLFPIGGWVGGGNIQTQINPGSLRANNYGNADYDIRNLFNADYVVTPPTHFENKFAKAALGGWQWSGKVFVRSGLPYTVTDGNTSPFLTNGGFAVADLVSGGASNSCGSGAAYTNTSPNPCLNASAFAQNVTGYTTYPNQTRNQFRGPNYIDFDMGLYKTFQVKERLTFGLGATAFNVFNHPNFNLPDTSLGSPQFGQILGMQGVPTSPYGNFLGFDSSVRVVQLSLKMSF